MSRKQASHADAAPAREEGQQEADARASVLEPHPDVLLYLEVPDELLKYYLSLSRASGMVYALSVKQLINRLYRDHDYVRRRKLEGRRTAYDAAVERDSQALAWLIAAAALYVPVEVKRHPVPPRPPKPVRRTPRSDKVAKSKARTKAQDQTQRSSGALQEGEDRADGAVGVQGGSRAEGEAIATVQALLDAAQALRAVRAAREAPSDGLEEPEPEDPASHVSPEGDTPTSST